MKNSFWIGALLLLVGCAKEDTSIVLSESNLYVQLSMSPISSRAMDQPVGTYVLPYNEIRTFRVELYESLTEKPIFIFIPSDIELNKLKATTPGSDATIVIKRIPFTTQYAKVFINELDTPDPDINSLQTYTIGNYFPVSKFPYEGTSELITIPFSNSIKVLTTVRVRPTLTRIEIVPDELNFVSSDKYIFDRVEGPAGRAKIIGFTEDDILNGEKSALADYKKRHGHEPVSPVYGYKVEQLYSTYPEDKMEKTNMSAYINYFKPKRSSVDLVKNENQGTTDSWKWASAKYEVNNPYMFDPKLNGSPNYWVYAFNLFPQSASSDDLATVQKEMPHVILRFHIEVATRATTNRDPLWLTMRSFIDKSTGKRITSFEPGTSYQLRYSDIPMRMWALQLKVDVRDTDGTSGTSDPIIENFDPTSNVPEPTDNGLSVALTVVPWSDYDIVTDL